MINQFIKADSGMLRDLYSTLLQFWGKNDLSACGAVLIVARCYFDFVFRLNRSRCGFLYRNGLPALTADKRLRENTLTSHQQENTDCPCYAENQCDDQKLKRGLGFHLPFVLSVVCLSRSFR